MRTRNAIAIVTAVLSVAASFVIVNAPLPAEGPTEAEGFTRVVVLTDGGWDCPDEAVDS
jgi:hypothetical protein